MVRVTIPLFFVPDHPRTVFRPLSDIVTCSVSFASVLRAVCWRNSARLFPSLNVGAAGGVSRLQMLFIDSFLAFGDVENALGCLREKADDSGALLAAQVAQVYHHPDATLLTRQWSLSRLTGSFPLSFPRS